MAYQFIHTQTYSRKGNGKNRSISDVVNEAARVNGFIPHVLNPQPVNILTGCNPLEIPALIEKSISSAKVAKGKGKAIRKDSHLLEATVASHPVYSEDLNDPEKLQDYERWRNLTIEHIKKDYESRGLELVSAVEHLDELHPHIHAYGIPVSSESNSRLNAKKCHPGHAAAALQNDVKEKSLAYKAAMRKWQDSYHAEVGEKCGLLRLGPARQRLDRKTYTLQKKGAEQLAETLKQAESIRIKTASQQNELDKMISKARVGNDMIQNQIKTILSLKGTPEYELALRLVNSEELRKKQDELLKKHGFVREKESLDIGNTDDVIDMSHIQTHHRP